MIEHEVSEKIREIRGHNQGFSKENVPANRLLLKKNPFEK